MVDKEKIREMRLEGMSYREIAKENKCSWQYVAKVLSGFGTDKHYNIRINRKIVYPNIRKWIVEEDISILRLAALMGYKESTTLTDKLYGKKQFKMKDIRMILELTGMTFEVAFEHEGYAKGA